jgi:single-stranded DNA-binding protein
LAKGFAMTTSALVTGQLFRAPERRTAKNGKPFVTGTLRVKDGEAFQWWKIIAFAEPPQAELMRLADGDAISAQGQLRVETYHAESGETKVSLTVIAAHVLALRQPPRKKRESKEPSGARHDTARAFDDPVPF